MSDDERHISMIDYIVLPALFIGKVNSCVVGKWQPDLMSDHVPITLRPCSHEYDVVPFHFGPFRKVVWRGVAFTRVRKKSSCPFQNRSRNSAVRKSEPEIGTIRYRTVPLSCEQKRYDIVPLSGPVWCLRVTPSWFLWPHLMSRLRLDLIAPH